LSHDFFNAQPASAFAIREVGTDLSNRDIKKPSFRCRSRYGDKKKKLSKLRGKQRGPVSMEQGFEGERRDSSLNFQISIVYFLLVFVLHQVKGLVVKPPNLDGVLKTQKAIQQLTNKINTVHL